MAAVEAVHPGRQQFLLGVLSSMFRQASDRSPALHCCATNMGFEPRCLQHSLSFTILSSCSSALSRCSADILVTHHC